MPALDPNDPQLLDELGIDVPEPANREQRRHPRQAAQLTDKQKRIIRRAYNDRRRRISEACRQHGIGNSLRVAEAVVHYQEITDLYRPGDLANPSQMTLARYCGYRTDDTIRKHLHRLESIGILTRFVPWPTRQSDGTYTRATTRYHLRDRIAAKLLSSPACPLPRRHKQADDRDPDSPTPNNLGVNSPTGVLEARRPVDKPIVCIPASHEQAPTTVGAPPAHPTSTDSDPIGPPWRNYPGGFHAWLAAQN